MRTTLKLSTITLLIAAGAYAANEINSNTATTFTKNGATYQISATKQLTVAGNYAYDAVLNVSTSGGSVSFGAAVPVGLVVVQNLTTNAGHTVTYGMTTNDFGIIQPGDWARFMVKDGTNLWLQATTNSCNVRVFAVSQ